MKITKKLLELGFKLEKDYLGLGYEAYVYGTSRAEKNRFVHEFAYYPDTKEFYINAHKTSTRTITESELLKDHNGLNTPAKEKWLEIKDKLKDYEFYVYKGV